MSSAQSPRRRKAAKFNLRRTPVQARGKATFDLILDTTAKLLDSVGVEAVNTNLIAKQAGINIATLYQYFTSKDAVLLALFERQSDARSEVVARHISGVATAPDWRRRLRALVRSLAESWSETDGVVPLRLAMRSSPVLQQYDREHWAALALDLAVELYRVGLRVEKAATVARTAIETLAALLDSWTAENGETRALDQIEAMLAGYLAPYIERRMKAAA